MSNNRWDWLGTGIYFWENGYQRALEFAQWKHSRGDIEEPMVLGAYIHLGQCFDLTDTWATSYLAPFQRELKRDLGEKLPVNRPASIGDFDLVLRDLDCAVLNYALRMANTDFGQENLYFQTVRGVFLEGAPIYEGARIFSKTHIQIAVRDPSCILGYFRPTHGYTTPVEAL